MLQPLHSSHSAAELQKANNFITGHLCKQTSYSLGLCLEQNDKRPINVDVKSSKQPINIVTDLNQAYLNLFVFLWCVICGGNKEQVEI